MAAKYPLIVDRDTQQIKELSANDDVDLSSNNIISVNNIIPEIASNYNLGSSIKPWSALHVDRLVNIRQSHSSFSVIDSASGSSQYDCSISQTVVYTNIIDDLQINLTNLNLSQGANTEIKFVLVQGVSAKVISQLSIDGTPQQILWKNNILPTGTDNSVDVIVFQIFNNQDFIILGSVATYTEVI